MIVPLFSGGDLKVDEEEYVSNIGKYHNQKAEGVQILYGQSTHWCKCILSFGRISRRINWQYSWIDMMLICRTLLEQVLPSSIFYCLRHSLAFMMLKWNQCRSLATTRTRICREIISRAAPVSWPWTKLSSIARNWALIFEGLVTGASSF